MLRLHFFAKLFRANTVVCKFAFTSRGAANVDDAGPVAAAVVAWGDEVAWVVEEFVEELVAELVIESWGPDVLAAAGGADEAVEVDYDVSVVVICRCVC